MHESVWWYKFHILQCPLLNIDSLFWNPLGEQFDGDQCLLYTNDIINNNQHAIGR